MPLPTEDLQALANQGVLSNVEGNVSDGLDFIPIADIAVHSPTEREADAMLGIQAPPQLQQQQSQQQAQSSSSCSNGSSCSSSISNSNISSTSTSSTNTVPLVEPMAPPKAPPPLSAAPISLPLISSKRKSTSSCLEEDASKKPRRALKSRQAKRSKI